MYQAQKRSRSSARARRATSRGWIRCLAVAVDRLGDREIINTVSIRSSAHTGAAVLEYRLIFPSSTDDTSLVGPVHKFAEASATDLISAKR